MKSFPNKMLRFCKIVGGLPVEYTAETRGIQALKFSNTGFLWSSTLIILLQLLPTIALSIYYMSRLNDQSLYKCSNITDIVITVDLVSLQVVAAVVFFSSAWKYPKLVSVFDTLERVYQDFQGTSDVKVTVKVLGICTAAVTFVTTAQHVITVIHEWVSVGRTSPFVISLIPMVLMYCPQAALFVQFTQVTQTISKSFGMVNAKIEMEITSCVNVGINHTACTMLSKVKKLRTLMNTYWMLCDTVHQANVFYCDQLMAVIFTSFVHITVTSYYFFSHIKDGNVIVRTNEGAWIFVHIFYVVLLLNSSTDVTNKADETGKAICRMVNTDLDQDLKKQLEGFLLQLPHHNARFSALGFFPIHNDTLTAMAGAVTTYLVIMIQFQTQLP